MAYEVLIVDDQEDIRQLVSDILHDEGYSVRTAADSHEALDSIRQHPPHLVILDIWLNDSRFDGIEILEIIRQNFPNVAVVMISGHGNIETAVSCLQKGAYDFIEKPFRTDRLLSIVAKGIEISKLQLEIAELRRRTNMVEDICGRSNAVESLRRTIHKIAKTNSRLLIEGPAGTGKEVVARLIHKQSDRSRQPFVVVNCASLESEKLAETLFGREENMGRPDFTVKIGLLEQANAGTLYLDNVCDMPRDVQATFLQVLHDQKFQRVGGTKYLDVDVRIISSSAVPLLSAVEKKRFREDLYYRLNVVPISMPSLVARKEDIPLLVAEFLERFCRENNRANLTLGESAMLFLQSYHWPGNVRQLRNVVEWLTIMAPENATEILPEMLPAEIRQREDNTDYAYPSNIVNLPLREAREQFERDYITLQINRFNGNIARTAQTIGMERTALHRKIKSLRIADEAKEG